MLLASAGEFLPQQPPHPSRSQGNLAVRSPSWDGSDSPQDLQPGVPLPRLFSPKGAARPQGPAVQPKRGASFSSHSSSADCWMLGKEENSLHFSLSLFNHEDSCPGPDTQVQTAEDRLWAPHLRKVGGMGLSQSPPRQWSPIPCGMAAARAPLEWGLKCKGLPLEVTVPQNESDGGCRGKGPGSSAEYSPPASLIQK